MRLRGDQCDCGHVWGSHNQAGCCQIKSAIQNGVLNVVSCRCTEPWYVGQRPDCRTCFFDKIKDGSEYCAKGYWDGDPGGIDATLCDSFSNMEQGLLCDSCSFRKGALYDRYGKSMCVDCYEDFERKI